MTSKIKVDNINKVSDDSNIIKKCGTTTTIGSGASNPIVVDGSAVTLGRCGGTVALASGATQTGFGRTGTVDWQTTPKTATFTAVSGEGYFANTSGGVFNITLPASPSAGDIVAVKDYGLSFQTNNLTVDRNGSNINGSSSTNPVLSTEGQSVVFVYVDATKGWIPTQDDSSTIQAESPSYMVATGGTVTTCGNCKIHTFTGPGTLTVTAVGNSLGSDKLGYMVVAGGAGGGGGGGGGGGAAGGFREAKGTNVCYTASPLAAPATITVTAGPTAYPITVGGGGTASSSGPEAPSSTRGGDGSNSVFSTITAEGGGGGGGGPQATGNPGGSGGGSFNSPSAAGNGNTPPVSPPQGNDGKVGGNPGGGAGGGALSSCSHCFGGAGGDGAGTQIAPASGTCGASGPLKYFAGGGGGGKPGPGPVPGPAQAPPAPSGFNGAAGGDGGGGRGDGGSTPGTTAGFACAGTTNTGGGGGGGGRQSNVTNYPGKAGGSGIVVIRYRYQ